MYRLSMFGLPEYAHSHGLRVDCAKRMKMAFVEESAICYTVC